MEEKRKLSLTKVISQSHINSSSLHNHLRCTNTEPNPSSEITHKLSNSVKDIEPQKIQLLFLCPIKNTPHCISIVVLHYLSNKQPYRKRAA